MKPTNNIKNQESVEWVKQEGEIYTVKLQNVSVPVSMDRAYFQKHFVSQVA